MNPQAAIQIIRRLHQAEMANDDDSHDVALADYRHAEQKHPVTMAIATQAYMRSLAGSESNERARYAG